MGFDHVDRKYQRPRPILLECAECGSTSDVQSDGERPLCVLCRSRPTEMDYYLGLGGP